MTMRISPNMFDFFCSMISEIYALFTFVSGYESKWIEVLPLTSTILIPTHWCGGTKI